MGKCAPSAVTSATLRTSRCGAPSAMMRSNSTSSGSLHAVMMPDCLDGNLIEDRPDGRLVQPFMVLGMHGGFISGGSLRHIGRQRLKTAKSPDCACKSTVQNFRR